MADAVKLPAGFVLDAPQNNQPAQLPAGFQLDAQPEPKQDKSYTGMLLPISYDSEGNASFDSNAGIVGAVKRAVMAPGRAMSGELQVMGPDGHVTTEAIGEAANFAGTVGTLAGTPAAGTSIARSRLYEEGLQRPGMETAAAASRLGVELPRAVASDSPAIQQLGVKLTNVPFADAPLRKASRVAIDQLGQAADEVVTSVGTGNVANAGNAARQGLAGRANFLEQNVTDEYNKVDKLITQNVLTPLTKTAETALKINARRENATLRPSGAVAQIQEAVSRPDGLNYQGIKDLRTSIGEILFEKDAAAKAQKLTAARTSEAELKQLYGALSDDLRSSVSRSGGQVASDAFEKANTLAAKSSREREALQKVLGNDISDERLFDRITAMAGSNARADRVSLARVKGAVGDDTWNEIASGVVARLGRDADGNFSPDRFITGYGRISPEGKQSLFGRGELASSLDDIATVSRRFKQLNQYANPSGSGSQVGFGVIVAGLTQAPITTINSVIGARAMSSLLAKPVTAKALASYSRAYANAAERPSPATLRMLENASRAVSAYVANDAGNKSLAAQIFPQISTVRYAPADQRNENQNVSETQDNRVYEESKRQFPNEL